MGHWSLPPSKRRVGGNTFEDGSGSGSCGLFRIKELISSRRQRRLAPSATATPCEVEFAEKEKRERLNGEVCASLYRITVGKRKLFGLSIAHLTIYLKASELFRYRS